MSFKRFFEETQVAEDNNAILVHNKRAKFAENIINGKKTIETRGVSIEKFPMLKDQPIELVTYIGKKKYTIGKVVFSEDKTYPINDIGFKEWEKDRHLHMVPEDSGFDLKNRPNKNPRYGWMVIDIEKYDKPKLFPYDFPRNGIKVIK